MQKRVADNTVSLPQYRHPLAGVVAAAVTPLDHEGQLILDDLPPLLAFLARRGCHGALLLGTTGEGTSFSPAERQAVLQAAIAIRQEYPGFRLLAGAGTPSLDETILLTRQAFDLGYDGVIVLPPYYYRKPSEDGLFGWYSRVIQQAVPGDGSLFGYHFPAMTGIGLSFALLRRLLSTFPGQFVGIKDSSGDPEHARRLGQAFGANLLVYSGNDALFGLALEHQAFGCITLMSNLCSPDLRRVWEAHAAGLNDPAAQQRLQTARVIMERYPPAPPLLKFLLPRLHGLPQWFPRLPLMPLAPEVQAAAWDEIEAVIDLFEPSASWDSQPR